MLTRAVYAAIPDVILDCDTGTDIDDMADIAILHVLADRGELNILATGFCMKSPYGAGHLEAINRFYGRPEIPVGVSKTTWVETPDRFGSLILTNYYNLVGAASNAPNAISLYRKILNERPDHSVTFLFTGMLGNLADLWHSPPDAFSPLAGRALMEKKVRRIYVVAGWFPDGGGEFNLINDAPSALVLNEIQTVPLTFAGTELGWSIPIGSQIRQKPEIDPVRVAHVEFYRLMSEFWRPSWSGVAIMDIARPLDTTGQPIYSRVKGSVVITPAAANSWVTNNNGPQDYLLYNLPTTFYQQQLDALLMTTPLLAPTVNPLAPVVRMDGQIIITPPFIRPLQSIITLENAFTNKGPIHFTLNGSAPTTNSPVYNAPFVLQTNATLRAIAYSHDFAQHAEIGPLPIQIVPLVPLNLTTNHGTIFTIPLINSSRGALSNTIVELFPHPAKGWKFSHWTNDATGNALPLNLKMDAPKNIQAVFEPDAAFARFSATMTGPDQIELRFTGAPGATATLYTSSNLDDWTPIHAIQLSETQLTFRETINPSLPRYYRAGQK